ncbi:MULTISPECIES: hypothetical protein [Delftia]|jgi:hypothetical protein|uniref:hypothetical protein n=1 Tax=Delftia TaxID=80865 RepID=UPI001D0CD013|nr:MULTISPECIES: hypothetical protein [Delftia]
MASTIITCSVGGGKESFNISDKNTLNRLMLKLCQLYVQSTQAADEATQYWADVATQSQSPLAPLAHVPGAFAALWTPEVAPTTAAVLSTAGYGFAALPRSLTHFTTKAGAAGIAGTGVINSSKFGLNGLFGPGVYMARLGRPLNLMIKEPAKIPIYLPTPAGTVRILPYVVYVRWGFSGVKAP